MSRITQFVCLLLLILLFSACKSDTSSTLPVQNVASEPGDFWPTQGWRTASPTEQGIDPAALARAAERAGKLDVHSLLVIRGGYLVSENYFAGQTASTPHTLYSVTKSFTAALVGIAMDKGLIQSLDQPVEGFFPNQQFQKNDANKSGMTLKHLLAMTSGLDWLEADATYTAMYVSRNWVQYVMNLPMREPPGQVFNYCSGCSHILSAVVQQVTGSRAADFASANLFQPLGITHYTWEKDAQGIPIGGWGLQLTPRDMAKLGYLYLHHGNWDGKQVVPQTWVEASTQTKVDAGDGWGYGYQWWIDTQHKAYAARGRYGQLIYVVPDLDLIVVVTAAINTGDPMMDVIYQDILPAVQEKGR